MTSKRFVLEKVYCNNKSEKSFKAYKNRSTFTADYIKKKGNCFSIVLIPLLLLTINYSGKGLNHFFHIREIKLVEKDEVSQDDDLIAKAEEATRGVL